MSDVVVIEYRDDWDALGPLSRHAIIPTWPRWITDGARWQIDEVEWPKWCITRFRDRDYACSTDPRHSPLAIRLSALTRCPQSWSWKTILTEKTNSQTELHTKTSEMLRSLPKLLDEIDPEILNRPDWENSGNDRYIGARLKWKDYDPGADPSEHNHCWVCWKTFSLLDGDAERTGFAVVDDPKFGDDYNWVCKSCFDDLKDLFNWVVVE
jgi:hypothetical protein